MPAEAAWPSDWQHSPKSPEDDESGVSGSERGLGSRGAANERRASQKSEINLYALDTRVRAREPYV